MDDKPKLLALCTNVLYKCTVSDMSQAKILDAVLEVAAGRGLEAVTVRSVAEHAGVSPAQVQYYFRTKDQMLVAAFEYVHQRMRQRVSEVDTTGPLRQVTRRYLLTWFPIEKARHDDASVWLAFTSAATTRGQFESIVHKADAEVLAGYNQIVEHGQNVGAIHLELEPETTASLMMAVVDGLSTRALSHRRPQELLAVLDQLLDMIFITDVHSLPEQDATGDTK